MPATTNPSAMITNISTRIVDAEVVVPAVLVEDTPPVALFFASSDTEVPAVVSAVGWMNSIGESLGGVVGSCVLKVPTGGSGHAGVGRDLVVAA